jgi:hypothetical protein
LTPLRDDLRAALPVIAVTIALALRPACWTWFCGGAVGNYALAPNAWKTICGAQL